MYMAPTTSTSGGWEDVPTQRRRWPGAVPDGRYRRANAHHPSPTSLLDRYQDGNVLVDVYSNAPQTVLAELATVKGLVPVPGYGG